MDLCKNGKLLCDLRKSIGMTQKQIADKLGIVPKTVSKWETGHGFPDISTVSALADILGVSEKTILSGNLNQNSEESGNMKRTKFYVCPDCGSIMQGIGNCQIICCGKQLEALKSKNTGRPQTVLQIAIPIASLSPACHRVVSSYTENLQQCQDLK